MEGGRLPLKKLIIDRIIEVHRIIRNYRLGPHERKEWLLVQKRNLNIILLLQLCINYYDTSTGNFKKILTVKRESYRRPNQPEPDSILFITSVDSYLILKNICNLFVRGTSGMRT